VIGTAGAGAVGSVQAAGIAEGAGTPGGAGPAQAVASTAPVSSTGLFGSTRAVSSAGPAEVGSAGRGEEADQREVEGDGDAGGDPLGVVAGWAGDLCGGDVGDQVGADSGGGQGDAQAAAELGQGGRLAVELAGQDRGPQGVTVGAERPEGHIRVGGQGPWPDVVRFGGQATGAAGPDPRDATGQAYRGPQQPAQHIDERHARTLTAAPDRRAPSSTAHPRPSRLPPVGRQRLAKLGSLSKALGNGKVRGMADLS
jgi:hypothetical protein